MSSSSWKFFTAPLTNKTNLFTIIVVTSIFAIFRLSGGSLFGTAAKPGATRGGLRDQSSQNQLRRNSATTPESNLLDTMLGKTTDKVSPTKAPTRAELPQDSEEGNGSGLDEIERAIGLR